MTTTLAASIAPSTMTFLTRLVIILLLTIMDTTIMKGGLVKSLERIGVSRMGRPPLTGLEATAGVPNDHGTDGADGGSA